MGQRLVDAAGMADLRCPVCGQSDPSRVRTVEVEGREIVLCDAHASVVVLAEPKTFEQLRGLFREDPDPKGHGDRRSLIERRDETLADRRIFPRPEGRRVGYGRRAADPHD